LRGAWRLGCGRTIDEIARWGSTDDADRAAVMAQLPERMKELEKQSSWRTFGCRCQRIASPLARG